MSSTQPRRLQGQTALLVLAAVLLAFEVLFLGQGARQGLWLISPGGGAAKVDFAEFWAAGRVAASGAAASAYHWPALRAVLETGAPGAFAHLQLPFFYPPTLFLLLAPLAAGPIWLFAAGWVGVPLAGFAAFGRSLGRGPALPMLALAAPAAFLSVCVGQNGVLTAALLGGGLALLDRRPVMAGVLLGLMAYKPQFGVLLPLALAVSGRWNSVIAAGTTVVITAGLSVLAFGMQPWIAFVGALTPGASGVPALSTLAPVKLQSVFGLAQVLGASGALAWALQAVAALAAALYVVWLWRTEGSLYRKAAGLAAAVLLVSPYSCVYDLTLTAVAVLFLAAEPEALGKIQRLALGAAYLAPLLFLGIAFPLGPILCALIIGAMHLGRVERSPAHPTS